MTSERELAACLEEMARAAMGGLGLRITSRPRLSKKQGRDSLLGSTDEQLDSKDSLQRTDRRRRSGWPRNPLRRKGSSARPSE